LRIITVEEELPLKQGLKPYFNIASMRFYFVEEELPLKQGLKLYVSIKTL